MDLSNRNVQQAAAPGTHPAAGQTSKKRGDKGLWDRVGFVAIVAGIVLLLLSLTIVTSFGGEKKESSYIDTSKLQAVFLNTGQVYFGNVRTLNSKYLVLTNIYYLQTSNNGQQGQNTNTNVSLVKLGCELHEPYDQMIINREQVTFWENLQDNGQVATAVSTFKKQNPNGQKCADQSSSSSTTSGNSAQPAGNRQNP